MCVLHRRTNEVYRQIKPLWTWKVDYTNLFYTILAFEDWLALEKKNNYISAAYINT